VAAEKAKKIYQVAKELNVATPAIVDYLEDRGFTVPKGHMSQLTDDMYTEVIKKFDPARWQRQIEDETRALEDARRAEAERARTEQSLKILDDLANQAQAAETLVQQVEEQQTARKRKKAEKAAEELEGVRLAEEQARKEEEERRLAEEKRKADEVERARQAAEEVARHETETREAELKKVGEQAPRRAKAAEPKPRAERRPRAEGGAERAPRQPAGERPARAAEERPARAPSEQPARAPGQRLAPGRPAMIADRTAAPATRAAQQAPAKAREGTLAPHKRRPTKEDIEQLEKQKKLLAAQKAEKYRKAILDGEQEAIARRKQRRRRVDQKEVSAAIKQTLASMDAGKKRHRRRERDVEVGVEETDKLRLTEFVTTQELANLMSVEVNEVIGKFLSMGKLVSINQRLEKDLIELMADEFGFQVEFVTEVVEQEAEEVEEERPEDLVSRPPVITVMGHVDHGKTSLLDFLRKTSVVAGEHGGITQHIGAYEVKYNGRSITFLDTPGHEAFTAMRARGAQVTDIVVLVVAADDQVRPQTVEAINHAQSAGVPIVVAINKIDKANADPERIRQQLAERNVLVEQWGGKVQSAEISAKFGQGIEDLLEDLLLAADVLELKANPDRPARATVVETRLEKGRGIIATLVITAGTLRVGDNFVAGQQFGKVRALLNEIGENVPQAAPGQPVQVIGFSGAPQAGDTFVVFESEREVKEIAMRRQLLQREQTFRQIRMLSLDQISERIREGGLRELSLIIKGDADGSVEAICDTLQRLTTSEVGVKIAHRGVGAISESDVLLASATGAIILGFHVHPNIKARELATREQVDIRVYRVIYEMEDDIRSALEGMLVPDTREDVVGLIEIRELFTIPKVGTICGCYVVSGKVTRQSQVRLLRDGRELWRGKLASLRRFKDDVREVRAGMDCGIGLDGANDIRIGDTLEVFEVVEIKRKLEQASA
jgi:translation initiation factor IF-2